MTAEFVSESPLYAVEGDVALTPGQRVRFLVAMPEACVEIGTEGLVVGVQRGDDTRVYVTVDGKQAFPVLDAELWKLELLPTPLPA